MAMDDLVRMIEACRDPRQAFLLLRQYYQSVYTQRLSNPQAGLAMEYLDAVLAVLDATQLILDERYGVAEALARGDLDQLFFPETPAAEAFLAQIKQAWAEKDFRMLLVRVDEQRDTEANDA